MQKNYPPEKNPPINPDRQFPGEEEEWEEAPGGESGQAHAVGGKPCHSLPIPMGQADVYHVHGWGQLF